MRMAIEKNAGFWKKFNDGLISAGAAAAITGVGLTAKAGFESLRDKIEKPRAFKKMLATSPSLKKQDPKAVQLTFNTLYGMNRRMAVDPLVAGSFVSRNVEREDVEPFGGVESISGVKQALSFSGGLKFNMERFGMGADADDLFGLEHFFLQALFSYRLQLSGGLDFSGWILQPGIGIEF